MPQLWTRLRVFAIVAVFLPPWGGATVLADAQSLAFAEVPSKQAQFPSAAAMSLLDKLSPFIARAEQTETASEQSCKRTDEGYFDCFDPKAVLEPNSGRGFIALQTRKLALRAVELYAGLVEDLAEGRDSGAVAKHSAELQAVLGVIASFAPLGGPVAAVIGPPAAQAIGQFAQSLEKSRSEDALRKALLTGEPIVAQIVDLLIADTAVMYRIYKSGRTIEIITIQNEMIAAGHQGTSGPRGQKDIDLIVDDINAYYQSLYSYVMFLGQTRQSIQELRVSEGANQTDADDMKRLQTAARQQATAQWLWKVLADTMSPLKR